MVTWLGELIFILKMLPDNDWFSEVPLLCDSGGEVPTMRFFGGEGTQIKNSVVLYDQFWFFGIAP